MSARSIVVTIPKAKLAEVEAEEAEIVRLEGSGQTDLLFYWEMRRLPKELPTRIYFVWNGAIRAWHEVVSERRYGIDWMAPSRLYMKTKINELATPIPMVGFQGFRYIEDPE